MPISRREFEQGRRELAEVLLQFLRENSEQAFTLEELCQVLVAEGYAEGYNVGGVAQIAEAAVYSLVESERVEVKEIEETKYYTYRSFLGFRPQRRE